MTKKEHNKSLKILGVVILSVCMLAIGYTAGKLTDFSPSSTLKSLVTERLDLNLFWQVWDVMESDFVEVEQEVTDQDKKYGAIKGLVDAYGDPATSFLTPEETEVFEDSNEGKYFEGIGAELGYDNGYIVIVTPLDGSPAKEAGIRPGDIILSVDGEDITKEDNLYDVVDQIRGESGTVVTLEVLHKGDTEPTEIDIERGEITVPSMSLEFLEGDIAYLDIARFTDATYTTWLANWEKRVEEILDRGSTKMILDLRSNPGGYFDAAIYAADDFLNSNDVLSIQEDGKGKQKEFKASKDGDLVGIDLVVLVDVGSASASEILAGALQYYDLATIVGESTYGKGTAQKVEDFTDGSSLHVTIYKWLLPNGVWINPDNPIEPDYKVELTDEDFKEGEDPQLDKALELLQ
jgi:carboxyl-terminal processing protease